MVFGWVVVAAIFGFYGWYRLNLRAVSSSTAPTSFTITPGQGQVETAKKLKDVNLIRSQPAFLFYVAVHNLSAKLQSGTYSISPALSTSEIARMFASGKVDQSHLTIPEGLTIAKIEQLAGGQGIKSVDFEAALRGSYDFSFLIARPAGAGLEGYLFPDSYQISSQTTAQMLIQSMLANFDRRVDANLRAGLTKQGLSLHEGLTLASIVEKEVANPTDRAIVAGIFLRRIKSGKMLESDVTVHYAADALGVPFSTNLNSPYNTYRHQGLPPGPICNPGLGSIEAVISPTATDYVYFLAGKDGATHFAKTLSEHERNVQRYLR